MKFKWTKIEQYAFGEIKWIVADDTLLTYLDFNEEFKIHINARNFQLGSGISQKGKTIYFYSRKLTKPQKYYTATEKDIPSIVESLKSFRTIIIS